MVGMSGGASRQITQSLGRQVAEQAAMARRDALLARARARAESWPTSAKLGKTIPSVTESGGRLNATRERRRGRLFGVRETGKMSYFYLRFQFLNDGRVPRKLPRLLAALARNPQLTHRADPSGWGRLGWLYQPRRSLSVFSVAEDRVEDGIADDALDSEARAPAEVFQSDPDAVVALANEDAGIVTARH